MQVYLYSECDGVSFISGMSSSKSINAYLYKGDMVCRILCIESYEDLPQLGIAISK